jgi:starvation-inducible outer membrane lipoprotein
MDAVTYPDPEVKKELVNWLEARVDVSLQKGVAELFSVAAIPVALAVTAEGRIVGRLTGFLEPESFKKEVATLREGLR